MVIIRWDIILRSSETQKHDHTSTHAWKSTANARTNRTHEAECHIVILSFTIATMKNQENKTKHIANTKLWNLIFLAVYVVRFEREIKTRWQNRACPQRYKANTIWMNHEINNGIKSAGSILYIIMPSTKRIRHPKRYICERTIRSDTQTSNKTLPKYLISSASMLFCVGFVLNAQL